MKCDYCGEALGDYCYVQKGYANVCCSPACVISIMLHIRKVKTKDFRNDDSVNDR